MFKYLIKISFLFLIFIFISCQTQKEVKTMSKELFGKLRSGEDVYAYTLTNKAGMKVKIINYGASVVSLTAPDKNGKFEDVVLGFDNLEGYVNGTSFIGATVGRYGNRIDKGRFKLNGKEYQLTINDGVNHLHGGVVGFHKLLWTAEPIEDNSVQAIKLSLISPDGDQGYPGNLKLELIYTLTNNNELQIDYSATTDKATIVNPTHHSYFNITGSPEKTILNNELQIDADYFTPVNNTLITTGELMKVENTPFDFRKPEKIGARIDEKNEQLSFGKGYDHNWVINNYDGSFKKIGELSDPESGRSMEILSDQPGMQFYSGNFLDGTTIGKGNKAYKYRTALCLETQFFPDSPNHPNFPSVVLNPSETYKQKTVYRFKIK